MSEYSTEEHFLQVHDNHSEPLAMNYYEVNDLPSYKHVENIKASASIVPFALMNATDVTCSPKFSLRK